MIGGRMNFSRGEGMKNEGVLTMQGTYNAVLIVQVLIM
jgi:hypothetical protein